MASPWLNRLKRLGGGEGGADGDGYKHHAGDSSDAEYQQIRNRPMRIADGREYQQGDGGGACQTVDNPMTSGRVTW